MLPEDFADRGVTIVGLGYVGMTLAVAMADVGFKIHGVEREEGVLSCLSSKQAHFTELGLNDKLALQIDRGRLSFSNALVVPTKVYIVTVGTPIGTDKRTKLDALRVVIEAIAAKLRDDDLVVLRSTVRVGITKQIVKPILDGSGKQYDLAFCPERTLEGTALQELRTLPQIVGGIDLKSTNRAAQLFSFLTPTIVKVSDLETAEVIKLINNTQRDLTFAFANEVAAVADAVGISAREVILSCNLGYPRSNMPLPGPVGGPCLEKDPYILAEGLERYGFVPSLALAGRRLNEGLPSRSADQIREAFKKIGAGTPARIAILGFAFKGRPETDDTRGSLVGGVIDSLRQRFPDSAFVGWDPLVKANEIAKFGVVPEESVENAFRAPSQFMLELA